MTDPVGPNGGASRREFLMSSTVAAGGALAAGLGFLPNAHAAASDMIRVGMIGCGGRGTGAATNAAEASANVKIVAMGDAFKDNLENSRNNLRDKLGKQFDVSDDRAFVGLDAYQKVLACELDYVILATPPGFRPQHLAAAVAAGKNIFTEKPVGTDGPGIRKVLEAAEEAKRKNLSVVAGTQRRHQAGYIECMKQIHDGAIGDVTSARVYWNQGGLWSREKQSSWSEMEWQVRNWLYFSWLSGDHICEQHVHNLDVANWALQSHPVRAVGMGGRQVRTAPLFGNIFDHFAIDYEYPNDVHVLSMCRQIDGCEGNVSETVTGTKGSWESNGYRFKGSSKFRFKGKEINPYVQEHMDLIESLRANKPLNELRQVAESTLTAIMGRMSAYTGKAVTWEDALNSKEDLFPKTLAWGPNPVPGPAVPGSTPLV